MIALVSGEAIAIYDPAATPEEVNTGATNLAKMIAVIASCLWVFSYVQYAFM